MVSLELGGVLVPQSWHAYTFVTIGILRSFELNGPPGFALTSSTIVGSADQTSSLSLFVLAAPFRDVL
jgi:hypothetical protein